MCLLFLGCQQGLLAPTLAPSDAGAASLLLTAELVDRWLLYAESTIGPEADGGALEAARFDAKARRNAGLSEHEVALVEMAVAQLAAARRVDALTQAQALAAIEQTRSAMRTLDAGAKAVQVLTAALGAIDAGSSSAGLFGREAAALTAWARLTHR